MEKYAKHFIAIVTIFFLSALYFQPSTIEADDLNGPEQTAFESNNSQQPSSGPLPAEKFSMACVSGKTLAHGLDTQMRRYGAQMSKNFWYAPRPGARPLHHRCYFKFPKRDLACFNPRFINPMTLEDQGFALTPSFAGGEPGQQCYFKKDVLDKYEDIIQILRGTTQHPELLRSTVRHPHEAVLTMQK